MVGLVSPYSDDEIWLRGNLHAHSTNSDGARPPDGVIDDYAARGYDFLAVSDHDVLTDSTEHRSGTAIELIPAVEISSNGPHMLHIGATEALRPHEDRQAVVDTIGDGSGVAVPAHPNWKETFAHWPQDELERVSGYAGIEIYNGLIEHNPGSATATGRWDQLLSAGRRVWGFANDDSHRPWEVAQGWNVVCVDERSPRAILNALDSGSFYASTGVTVHRIDVTDGNILVETADANRIRLISDHGVVQQSVASPTATFRVPEQLVHQNDHHYVRVECLGHGGEMAWLQPMFLE